MSVVINYVSDYISVIATDTRITSNIFGLNCYYDGNKKLYNLPLMGWSAGVGLHQFLEVFKNKISTEIITDTKQIIDLYKEAIREIIEEYPSWRGYVEKSYITCSWVTIEKNQVKCRLGIISKDIEGYLGRLENDKIFILYPIEYVNDPKKARELERRYDLNIKFKGQLEEVLYTMIGIFKELALNTKSISRVCDIGVQLITQDGIYKINICDDIDHLLVQIENSNIYSKMQIVDFLDLKSIRS